MLDLGTHTADQNIHIPIAWKDKDLEIMVYRRVKEALQIVESDAKKMLEDEFYLKFNDIKSYTFGRPRDYIQLYRYYFEEIVYADVDTLEDARKDALINYCGYLLGWLRTEWQVEYGDYDSVIEFLPKVNNLSKDDMIKILNEYRDLYGKLNFKSVNDLINTFEQWGFIEKSDDKYNCHKVFKYREI